MNTHNYAKVASSLLILPDNYGVDPEVVTLDDE